MCTIPLVASLSDLFTASVLGFLFAFFLVFAAAQIPLRAFLRIRNAHWTEQARYAYQVGRTLRWHKVVCLALLIVLISLFYSSCPKSWESLRLFGVIAFGVISGALSAQYFIVRQIYPRLRRFRLWFRELCVRVAPMYLLFGVYFALYFLLSRYVFKSGLTAIILAWIISYLLSAFGGSVLALRIFGLRRASLPLEKLVCDVCAQRGVANPKKIYEFDSVYANAWAMPTTKSLLFTSELFSALTEDERRAVISHELAHLAESPRQVIARLLPGLLVVPMIAAIFISLQENAVFGLAVALAAFLLLGRWTRRLSQKLEIEADKKAVVEQFEAGTYARALERIYESGLIPAMLPKRMKTHPDLYDRLLASGTTPSFARPKLPPKKQFYLAAAMTSPLIIGAILVGCYAFAQSKTELQTECLPGSASAADDLDEGR